jgi:hypothetical protein
LRRRRRRLRRCHLQNSSRHWPRIPDSPWPRARCKACAQLALRPRVRWSNRRLPANRQRRMLSVLRACPPTGPTPRDRDSLRRLLTSRRTVRPIRRLQPSIRERLIRHSPIGPRCQSRIGRRRHSRIIARRQTVQLRQRKRIVHLQLRRRTIARRQIARRSQPITGRINPAVRLSRFVLRRIVLSPLDRKKASPRRSQLRGHKRLLRQPSARSSTLRRLRPSRHRSRNRNRRRPRRKRRKRKRSRRSLRARKGELVTGQGI